MIPLRVGAMARPKYRRCSPEFNPVLCTGGGGGLETGKFKRVRTGERTAENNAVV